MKTSTYLKTLVFFLSLLTISGVNPELNKESILIEAESFGDYGGL